MKERETFGSRLGFILVSAGCAIGLGNVWKFPYICGQYGGAAFILIYLLFLVILGLPMLICEFAVGRGSRRSMATAFEVLEPKGGTWHRLKWISVVGCYMLMMFYAMVAGWILYYAYRMIRGELVDMDPTQVTGAFTDMLGSAPTMIFWTLLTVIVAFLICALGLNNGIEKVSKVLMGFLLVLIVVLAVHSLFLKGAGEGVRFYLIPNMDLVREHGLGTIVYAAMAQAFFTLGLGVGSMTIFGSYMHKTHALLGESVNIVLLDTFVALMSGFIIIPACFAFGVEPGSGPALLFMTLPNVFNNMANGRIWGIFFFVFMSFAALTTVIAVFENLISMCMDIAGWSRKKSVAINIVLMSILTMPAVLGFNVLSGIQIMGAGTNLMDLEDFIVSYNLLPLGSITFIMFCVRKNGWGWKNFTSEVNTGQGIKFPVGKAMQIYMTYILPIIIAGVYLKGYYDFFKPQGTATVAVWMSIAVVLLILVMTIITRSSGKKQ